MDARSQFHHLELQSTMVCPSTILQSQIVLKKIHQRKLNFYRETKKKSISSTVVKT